MNHSPKKTLGNLSLLAVVAFLANLLWENLQAPLYKGYSSFWAHLPICAIGALGDILIILIPYLAVAAKRRDILWIYSITYKDIVLTTLGSLIIAFLYEWYALHVGRFVYTEAMPIIPFTRIGAMPILQMIVLPIVTLYTGRLISREFIYGNR